jgi:cell division protein FtsN
MKKTILFLIGAGVLFVYGCSSTSESTKDDSNQDDVYVFDDVSGYDSVETAAPSQKEDTTETTSLEKSDQTKQKVYYVQIGAFTDKNRADKFLAENAALLDKEAVIRYSERVELFVIQMPPLYSREEAEKLRNKLWNMDQFEDAWILTKEE